MRAILVVAAALLAGCDSRAEILEREYKQTAGHDARCEAARKVADAWLERNDEQKRQEWATTRDIDCLYAKAI